MWDKAKEILSEELSSDSFDLSDIEELRFEERGEQLQLLDWDSDERVLVLNLDALDDNLRKSLTASSPKTVETQNHLLNTASNELQHIQRALLADEEIKKSITFFEEHLRGAHLELLERSLLINKAYNQKEFPSNELNQYKRDIANDFSEQVTTCGYDAAYTAIHMAGSGYLHRDGHVASIFSDIEASQDDEPIDYNGIFTTIIKESPFLVTIGSKGKSAYVSEFSRKISKSDDYRFDVEFIDGVAQGAANRELLEQVILELQRVATHFGYYCRVVPGKTTYRIYPEQVKDLPLN